MPYIKSEGLARNQFWMQKICTVDMHEPNILMKLAFNCSRVNNLICLFILLTKFWVGLMTFVIFRIVLIKQFIFKEQALISPNRCPLPPLNQLCMCAGCFGPEWDPAVAVSVTVSQGSRGLDCPQRASTSQAHCLLRDHFPRSVPTVNTPHIWAACASHACLNCMHADDRISAERQDGKPRNERDLLTPHWHTDRTSVLI